MSQAEHDPLGLLGYDCRRLKLEKRKARLFRGQFWIPVRKSRTKRLTEPRKVQLQRLQAHTDLLSTHSTPVGHKMSYSNTYNTALTLKSTNRSDVGLHLGYGRTELLVVDTSNRPVFQDMLT